MCRQAAAVRGRRCFRNPPGGRVVHDSASDAIKVKVAAGAKETKTTAATAGRTAPLAKSTKHHTRRPSTAKKTRPSKKKPFASAAAAKKKSKPAAAKLEGSKRVLVMLSWSPRPRLNRTISELLEKAAAGGRGEGGGVGGGEGELYMGYTVDAWNGNVTDLVGKRRDVPAGGAEGGDQGLGCGWRGRGKRLRAAVHPEPHEEGDHHPATSTPLCLLSSSELRIV